MDQTSPEIKYKEITQAIIGCAMQVHNTLGNGFQEVIYQRAMEIEMHQHGLTFEREKEMEIFYRGQSIGIRRVDFFVANCIMVELKAVIQLEDVHLAQAMNYLEAYHMEIGLLINFGARSLQFKRVHNNKLIQKSQQQHPNQANHGNHDNHGDNQANQGDNQVNQGNHGGNQGTNQVNHGNQGGNQANQGNHGGNQVNQG
jgi:GxxExxY protein